MTKGDAALRTRLNPLAAVSVRQAPLFGSLDGNALGNRVVMRGHVLPQLQAGILSETGPASPRAGFGVLLLRGQVFPAVIAGNVEIIPGGTFAVLQQNRVSGPETAGRNSLEGLLELGAMAGGAAVGSGDVDIIAGRRGAGRLLADTHRLGELGPGGALGVRVVVPRAQFAGGSEGRS